MEGPNGKQATGTTGTEEGKIFVGGLSWDTTKESLRAHFEQFGAVADTTIMMDNQSKRPRGFGFVQFVDPATVDVVMDFSRKKGAEPVKHHIIDGKQVDPKPAVVKGANTDLVGKKVFIGGLGHDTTEEDIHSYFSQYGTVSDIDLKGDNRTSKKKGFAFVTFDNESSVDEVVKIHFHQLKGKTVECKKALPRTQTSKQQQQNQPYYGGAAPYGGYGQPGGEWAATAGGGGYNMYQQQQQPQSYPPQQYAAQTGNYMRGGYAQSQAGGYHMGGRGDMHNPSAPPTAVPHQGHMTQGYGRGHDATSYTSGPATGYGQAAAAGGGAYGTGQGAYGYDSMGGQVGTQPTGTPYGATAAYGDTTANTGYPVAGGGPQHKQQKPYNSYY